MKKTKLTIKELIIARAIQILMFLAINKFYMMIFIDVLEKGN